MYAGRLVNFYALPALRLGVDKQLCSGQSQSMVNVDLNDSIELNLASAYRRPLHNQLRNVSIYGPASKAE